MGQADGGGRSQMICANPSCVQPTTDSSLYDETKDQYYCDLECLQEYLSEHIEEALEVYVRFNIE